ATDHAPQSVSFADGTHEYFQYDSLGRVTKTTLDGGADPVSYSYDAFGELTTTDATGARTTLSPNEFLQYAQVQDPLGRIVSALFDKTHTRIQTSGPLGATITVSYNGLNDLTSLPDPLGDTINMTYSPATGSLASLTDARGFTTSYTSDVHGNLLTIR